jgi:hypothetical protein
VIKFTLLEKEELSTNSHEQLDCKSLYEIGTPNQQVKMYVYVCNIQRIPAIS